jgi:hypothetical protein
MKRLLIIVLFAAGIYVSYNNASDPAIPSVSAPDSDATIVRAYNERRESYQVEGAGTVSRLLSDDNDGSRHQRFILKLASGHTLMIAHNIDLAPRIQSIRNGDRVGFFGEYEWNPRGGVIHWTHHDPQRRHVDGWLEHDGRRYQ